MRRKKSANDYDDYKNKFHESNQMSYDQLSCDQMSAPPRIVTHFDPAKLWMTTTGLNRHW